MANPLREQLPRTYGAFLGRFERPTAVQEGAVPPILAGRDALLCAPTASGKTEAYAAPACELLMAGERRPFSLLVVSPTRALANDLKRRLEGALDALGIAFGRYTGEHKERRKSEWPAAVVTTPEGLDSLVTRRPHVLEGVRTVVLDEVHVLDGTPRGDQLRVLLHRLDGVASARPQRVAASATVEAPEELAARYLRDAAVVVAEGGRKVQWKSFRGATPDAVCRHLEELARSDLRKVLVFCNSREDVERLAAAVRGRTPFGERVFAHHGSLSRTVRERTERRFLEAPAAVAVATMTLELGIDIGSVDYVLLVRPPGDVSGLMQRAGRGGRRSGTMRVGTASRDAADELVFRVMLRCGVRGRLCEPPYAFRPSVLVQQAICLAGAGGWVDAARLERATPPALRASLGAGFAAEVLEEMGERDVFEPPRAGRYVLAEAWERRYDRGTTHSNFTDAAELPVFDRLTGDEIGRIDPAVARGASLRLGGQGRREVQHGGERVLTDQAAGGAPARYMTGAAAAVSFRLARAVAEELGAGPDEVLVFRRESSWCLLHGLGTLGGLLLAAVAKDRRLAGAVGLPSAYTLPVGRPPEEALDPEPADVERFLTRNAAKLGRALQLGQYHAHLPERLRADALRAAAGLDEPAAFLRRARWRRVEAPDELEEAAQLL